MRRNSIYFLREKLHLYGLFAVKLAGTDVMKQKKSHLHCLKLRQFRRIFNSQIDNEDEIFL